MNETQMFLAQFGRRRPTLAYIKDAAPICQVYRSPRAAALGSRFWNAKGWNCYFVGNSHRLQPDSKSRVNKPKASDIELSVGAWVDVDNCGQDADVVATLIEYLDWRPTYIVASGGGLQAFWRFDEFTDAEEGSAVNRWLIDEFVPQLGRAKGDQSGVDIACSSADHRWRLPGTLNIKRQRKAKLLDADWSARLPLAEAGRKERWSGSGGLFEVSGWGWVTKEWLDGLHLPNWFNQYFWDSGEDRSAHQYRFLRKWFQCMPPDQMAQEAAVALLLIETQDPRFVSHCSHFERSQNGFKPRPDPIAHAVRQVRQWVEKEAGHEGQ